MPSETVPNQTIPATTANPQIQLVPSPSNGKPLPVGNMDLIPSKEGESPLDFLKKNAEIPGTPNPMEKIFNQVKDAHEAESLQPKKDSGSVQPLEAPKEPTEKKQEASNEPAPFGENDSGAKTDINPDPTDLDTDDASIPEAPAREAFKALRDKYKTANKTLKEREAALAKAQKDLEDLNTGKAHPALIAEKEAEIERLKPFEKLHNLKTSPEYQEKFITPLNQKKEKLKSIFTEYEIPAEVQDDLINKAINSKSERELNTFLSENFDGVGALEVKGILNSVKSLTHEARAAEADPAKVLTELQAQGNQAKLVADTQRKIKIYESAKGSWAETLSEIRAQGSIPELVRRDNDPEFNQKFVDPILTQASKDFEALVKELTEAGAKDLSPNVLKGLAKSFLLAHATGVAVATRTNALKHIESLENGTERLNGILRPNIGGGVPHAPSAAPAQALTPEQEAQNITQSILSKRR